MGAGVAVQLGHDLGGVILMGVVYCGPYAEQVGYEHEGYAARALPEGTLTSSWTLETDEFRGYVAACGCGWTGAGRVLPGSVQAEDSPDN